MTDPAVPLTRYQSIISVLDPGTVTTASGRCRERKQALPAAVTTTDSPGKDVAATVCVRGVAGDGAGGNNFDTWMHRV